MSGRRSSVGGGERKGRARGTRASLARAAQTLRLPTTPTSIMTWSLLSLLMTLVKIGECQVSRSGALDRTSQRAASARAAGSLAGCAGSPSRAAAVARCR